MKVEEPGHTLALPWAAGIVGTTTSTLETDVLSPLSSIRISGFCHFGIIPTYTLAVSQHWNRCICRPTALFCAAVIVEVIIGFEVTFNDGNQTVAKASSVVRADPEFHWKRPPSLPEHRGFSLIESHLVVKGDTLSLE